VSHPLQVSIPIAASALRRDIDSGLVDWDGVDLKGKAKIAFEYARNDSLNWMLCGGEDSLFRLGCGILLTMLGPDSADFRRIKAELNMLRDLNAMMQGVPVSLEQMMEDHEDGDHLGLMGIWHRTKDT